MNKIFTLFLTAVLLAPCTASAQSLFRSTVTDLARSSGPAIRYNTYVKTARYVCLYQNGGLLDYIRFEPSTGRMDTVHFDHQRLEELAYQTAFGDNWTKQLLAIQRLGYQAQPNLRTQEYSASGDTLTTMIGLYSVNDPSSVTIGSDTLKNTILMARFVGTKLVLLEDYTAWTERVRARMDKDCYPLPDFVIAQPGFFVMSPIYTGPTTTQSKTLFRFSRTGQHDFLGWENLAWPEKFIAKSQQETPLSLYDGDYFLYSLSDQLYRFSNHQQYDLSKVLTVYDTSYATGIYEDERQVHDVQDLGDGKLALLVRHGSNLRLMHVQLDGKTARLVDARLVAAQYPNPAAKFPAFYGGGKCFAFDKTTGKFRLLATD